MKCSFPFRTIILDSDSLGYLGWTHNDCYCTNNCISTTLIWNIQLWPCDSFLHCSFTRNFSTTFLMCMTSSSRRERRYSNMMSFSSQGFSESSARFLCRAVSLRTFPVIPFKSFLLSHLCSQGGLFNGTWMEKTQSLYQSHYIVAWVFQNKAECITIVVEQCCLK